MKSVKKRKENRGRSEKVIVKVTYRKGRKKRRKEGSMEKGADERYSAADPG